MGLYLADTRNPAEDTAEEEEGNCLVEEVSGVDKESDEGESEVKLAGMAEIVFGCS